MRQITFLLSFFTLLTILAHSFLTSATAGGMTSHEMLIDTEWQWEKTLYNNDTENIPENPERYSLKFNEDGSFSGVADCNRIRGNYTLPDGQIVIGPIMSTRAMCPPDSLSSVFLKDLQRTAIIFFKEGKFYIDLKYHTGTMIFLPALDKRTETKDVDEAQTVSCKNPRPEACTMEYAPVCGEKANNVTKTYSNVCHACSDPDVIRYRSGECP